MMRASIFLVFLLFWITAIQAQYVETILTHPELRDGLHVDSAGNIYTTSGGLAGFEIGQYNIQTGLFDPNFARGFFGPVDVDLYRDSLLIVSNYDNNTVSAYNLNSKQSSIIATGLDGPSGIVIDAQDNIYVASWGNAPAYAGRQIHKIKPSGEVIEYINSPALYRPQAMTTDLEGRLIVHSEENLYRVNPIDSSLQLWVNVGTTIGHLVYRQKDSCIYGTAGGISKILKITPSGEVSHFAGSSEGFLDGPVDMARFRASLGIEFSPNEDTMYVCDSGYGQSIGRLRRIIMSEPVSVDRLTEHAIHIFPNPFSSQLSIDQKVQQKVLVEIFDIRGNPILAQIANDQIININTSHLPSGTYIIKLNYPEGVVVEKFLRL